MWMLRRDTVVLCETSGSMHRSKHVSLKSKGDVSVRENKYPMAMQSLDWNLRTAKHPRAQVLRLWVTLPRAAVPWCSWTDPKDPMSPFQTSLTVLDAAAELLVGFFFKEKGRLMWSDGLQSQPKRPLRSWLYSGRAHLKPTGGCGGGWHILFWTTPPGPSHHRSTEAGSWASPGCEKQSWSDLCLPQREMAKPSVWQVLPQPCSHPVTLNTLHSGDPNSPTQTLCAVTTENWWDSQICLKTNKKQTHSTPSSDSVRTRPWNAG